VIIFKYEIRSFFSVDSNIVELDDAKQKDNVHCYVKDSLDRDIEDYIGIFYTIPACSVANIKQIIMEYRDLQESEGVDARYVLDGCENDISIPSDTGELHTIRCCNLSWFRDLENPPVAENRPIEDDNETLDDWD
jgi:hypothetical protein